MDDLFSKPVQHAVAVFDSHEAAEAAEREYYWSLTPSERIQILLELNQLWIGEEDASPASGSARVRATTEPA